MRDTNLIFNSNASVSTGSASAILDIGKWAVKGVWVEILQDDSGVVGGAPQTAAQLTATMQYSDSATFAGQASIGPQLVTAQNTAGFRMSRLCQSKRRYARISYTTTGTSPCFTGIYAHITSGANRDDGPGVNTT